MYRREKRGSEASRGLIRKSHGKQQNGDVEPRRRWLLCPSPLRGDAARLVRPPCGTGRFCSVRTALGRSPPCGSLPTSPATQIPARARPGARNTARVSLLLEFHTDRQFWGSGCARGIAQKGRPSPGASCFEDAVTSVFPSGGPPCTEQGLGMFVQGSNAVTAAQVAGGALCSTPDPAPGTASKPST